jgi:ribosomal protein L40E
MTLKRISCPSCGSSQFRHDDEGNLICEYCGTKFASPREEIVCPACGTENPPDARRCMQCGLMLGKSCPVCNHVNPPAAEYCEECASPLDVLESVYERARGGGRQKGMIKKHLVRSKQADMAYMQTERERIDAEERERQARLLVRQEQAQRQQKVIVAVTLAIVALLIVFGIVLALFLSQPGG